MKKKKLSLSLIVFHKNWHAVAVKLVIYYTKYYVYKLIKELERI